MAEETPDKIIFGIGQGKTRAMVRLADGSYADRYAPASGAGIVTDNTGQFTFDIGSLASAITYDENDNQTSITYGPDMAGRYIRQTSQWGANNKLMGDSDWQLVNADGVEVDGEGNPL